MQRLTSMLGSLVLLACLAAGGVVACILFVLFGPVPVRRKVNMVSRIQPSMPLAAMPVMFELPPPPPVVALPPPQPTVVAAVEPPKMAPLVLRRPRGESPPPLPRSRAARGTAGRPRHTFDTLEVTAREAPAFEADERTSVDDWANS